MKIEGENKKFRLVYEKGYNFILNEFIKIDLNKKDLDKYLKGKRESNSLNDISKNLFISISNRNMMSSVINFKKNEKIFEKILFQFDPKKIIDKFSDSEDLLNKFDEKFKIKNLKSPLNLWRQFSKGIISGSKFLSSFKDIREFKEFVDKFKYNKYTRVSLPMLLSKEINGIGFALACDFLKELGYKEYPKPDIHLIEIFYQTGLSKSKNDYEVFKDIIKMAGIVNQTPYYVDKIFWLIGSGNLYLNKNLKLKQNRNKFILEINKE